MLLVLAFAAIAAIEVPGMLKKKQWGELAAFTVILALTFGLSAAMTLRVKVPNPTRLLMQIFGPLAPK